MNLHELLDAALEAGIITEEQVKEVKGNYVAQEEVNRIVSQRVNKVKEKYKNIEDELAEKFKSIEEENQSLKSRVSELDAFNAEKEKLSAQIQELSNKLKSRELNDVVNGYLNEVLPGKKLPDIYREKIALSDDVEAVKKSVDEVVALYKQNHPVEFGGGINPGNNPVNFSKMSQSDLLKLILN